MHNTAGTGQKTGLENENEHFNDESLLHIDRVSMRLNEGPHPRRATSSSGLAASEATFEIAGWQVLCRYIIAAYYI